MTTPTDLVLLLPGWGTPATRLGPMADALTGAGTLARVWSYTPQGAFPELVEQFATAAEATLEMHEQHDRLHLVGHSLGGLVVAATALQRLPGRVASVTTINTPWRGTWVSYTGTGPLARALRRGSPMLSALREQLRTDLDEHDDGARWLLLAAAGDLATPATTSLAVLSSSDRLHRRVVAATGHSVSLTSDRVIDAVRAHVLDTDPEEPDPSEQEVDDATAPRTTEEHAS